MVEFENQLQCNEISKLMKQVGFKLEVICTLSTAEPSATDSEKHKDPITTGSRAKANGDMADNGRYAGIDIGVDNLLTMAANTGVEPLIVNGRVPKSVNQFYNKKLAHLQSVCQRMTGRYSSKRIIRLTAKRNRRIEDYLHKASKLLIMECVKQKICTIVIGQNKNWKQESKLCKRANQHFVQLPFSRLIQMIGYKAKEDGIAVVLTEESYTSGTSFLDGEVPLQENYNRNRRIYRGLFRTDSGRLINADVNGAFQILRKVFPNVSADGIEGVVLRPVVVVAA